MHIVIAAPSLHVAARERQQQAQADNLAARLAAVRRWERRVAAADRRARLARAALG